MGYFFATLAGLVITLMVADIIWGAETVTYWIAELIS